MNTALNWHAYVAGYTFVFGLCTLILPHQVLPLFGFTVNDEPWVRIAGMFAFGFSYLAWYIYRNRLSVMLPVSLRVRSAFMLCFLALGMLGYSAWMFAFALIVGIGVAGTFIALSQQSNNSH